jgi:hypothetical protein
VRIRALAGPLPFNCTTQGSEKRKRAERRSYTASDTWMLPGMALDSSQLPHPRILRA